MIPRPFRRAIAFILVPVVASGCYNWRVVDVEPRTLVESEHPSRIRVTTSFGQRMEITAPRIAGDSVTGTQSRAKSIGVAIALTDVTRTETEHFNAARTVGLIALVTVPVLILIVVGLATYEGPF